MTITMYVFTAIGALIFLGLAFEAYRYLKGHPQALATLKTDLVKVESVATRAHDRIDSLIQSLRGTPPNPLARPEPPAAIISTGAGTTVVAPDGSVTTGAPLGTAASTAAFMPTPAQIAVLAARDALAAAGAANAKPTGDLWVDGSVWPNGGNYFSQPLDVCAMNVPADYNGPAAFRTAWADMGNQVRVSFKLNEQVVWAFSGAGETWANVPPGAYRVWVEPAAPGASVRTCVYVNHLRN